MLKQLLLIFLGICSIQSIYCFHCIKTYNRQDDDCFRKNQFFLRNSKEIASSTSSEATTVTTILTPPSTTALINIYKDQEFILSQFLDYLFASIDSHHFESFLFKENKLSLSASSSDLLTKGKIGSHTLKEIFITPKILKLKPIERRGIKQTKHHLSLYPTHLQFHYKYQTNDQMKNYSLLPKDRKILEEFFFSLFREIPFQRMILTERKQLQRDDEEEEGKQNKQDQNEEKEEEKEKGNEESGKNAIIISYWKRKTRKEEILPSFSCYLINKPSTIPHKVPSNKQLSTPGSTHDSQEKRQELLLHDQPKQHLIPIDSPFLQSLNITTKTTTTSTSSPTTGSSSSLLPQLRTDAKDKFYQINKFIEIFHHQIQNLLRRSKPSQRKTSIAVTDMGCGKGYLTFAIYDYLQRHYGNLSSVVKEGSVNRKIERKPFHRISIVGIEQQIELIQRMTSVKNDHDPHFSNLSFFHGSIHDYLLREEDPIRTKESALKKEEETENKDEQVLKVLVALHACDIATDEALFHAIQHNYDLILAVPCCQKELRSSLKSLTSQFLVTSRTKQRDSSFPLSSSALRKIKEQSPLSEEKEEEDDAPWIMQTVLSEILQYPIYRERWNDILTDTLRSMVLQYYDYETNIIEFVSSDHTAKNIMIVAVKRDPSLDHHHHEEEEAEDYDLIRKSQHQSKIQKKIIDLMKINRIESQHLIQLTKILGNLK